MLDVLRNQIGTNINQRQISKYLRSVGKANPILNNRNLSVANIGSEYQSLQHCHIDIEQILNFRDGTL